MVTKATIIVNVVQFLTYFWEKTTLNELFLWYSQFWEILDFLKIGI
jgi:hypothetical protein